MLFFTLTQRLLLKLFTHALGDFARKGDKLFQIKIKYEY